MLNAPALVPSDQNAAEGHSDNDLYLFAFLSGLVAASQEDVQKAQLAGQPTCLIHAMPDSWTRPMKWNPLGRLVLKSESAETQVIEIGGQDAGRETRSLTVEIPPRTRVEVEEQFYSVSHLRTQNLPEARIGIHSAARRETHLIGALEWGNIWLYGMEIWLAGWLTRGEFNQRARFVEAGRRVFQYDKTRTKNLAVPVSGLKSVSELFEKVKAWTTH
jgi:hypothetical protein